MFYGIVDTFEQFSGNILINSALAVLRGDSLPPMARSLRLELPAHADVTAAVASLNEDLMADGKAADH
ncbi:hypothetical protein [Mesorhizobium sp. M1342]|uniref:hypothetical protein n=1 Tax=Mesorhizobium sp. M1342 TaxID=2957088 RepID=UPI003339B568